MKSETDLLLSHTGAANASARRWQSKPADAGIFLDQSSAEFWVLLRFEFRPVQRVFNEFIVWPTKPQLYVHPALADLWVRLECETFMQFHSQFRRSKGT